MSSKRNSKKSINNSSKALSTRMSKKKSIPSITVSNYNNNNQNNIQPLICSFCLNERKVKDFRDEYLICNICEQIYQLSRTDDSVYYHVATKQYFKGNDFTLDLGNNSNTIKNPGDNRILILDFHKVCDLYEPEGLKDLLEGVSIPIFILSYVGPTSKIRILTHQNILEYDYDSIFCFVKNKKALPGTKGHFMLKLKQQGYEPILLDDSPENIKSAIDAKCTGHIIKRKKDMETVINSFLTLSLKRD